MWDDTKRSLEASQEYQQPHGFTISIVVVIHGFHNYYSIYICIYIYVVIRVYIILYIYMDTAKMIPFCFWWFPVDIDKFHLKMVPIDPWIDGSYAPSFPMDVPSSLAKNHQSILCQFSDSSDIMEDSPMFCCQSGVSICLHHSISMYFTDPVSALSRLGDPIVISKLWGVFHVFLWGLPSLNQTLHRSG
jgi:hypothetical protein